MDRDQVKRLEDEIELAVTQALRRLSKSRSIPKPRSDRTYHLMAKAAVAVFEAVEEERGEANQ